MHSYVRNMIAIVMIVPIFIATFYVLFNFTVWFAGFTIVAGAYAMYLNLNALRKERRVRGH